MSVHPRPSTARTIVAVLDNFGTKRRPAPLFALKPVTSLAAPGDDILRPPGVQALRPEAEIALVVGTTLRWASHQAATRGVAGYTIANDLTAMDHYHEDDGTWGRAKAHDTFTPVSDQLVAGLPPLELEVVLSVDGRTRCTARVADMQRDPLTLLVELSQVMTLHPGDLVLTGSPLEGPGVVGDGETVTVECEGLTPLSNTVRPNDDRREDDHHGGS